MIELEELENIEVELDSKIVSMNYNDAKNKPKINNVELIGNKTTDDLGIVIPDVSEFITKDVDDLTNYTKTSNLSSVATSGNYNDLNNKPAIPDELADLSDDSTHRTVSDTEKTTWNNKSDFSGNYNDLTNKPTIPTVPTNVSAFTNDAGYLTQHQDISGKEDTTNKTTTIDENSTDTQYPSAKCVYEAIQSGGGSGSEEVYFVKDNAYGTPFIFDGKKKGIYYVDNTYDMTSFYYKATSTDTLRTFNGQVLYFELFKDITYSQLTNFETFGHLIAIKSNEVLRYPIKKQSPNISAYSVICSLKQDISGKLDTSAVKTSTDTTQGNVYDVTYINTMLGDVESLLGGI